MPGGPLRGWASGSRAGTARGVARFSAAASGGEGGFNLAQPPEVSPHLWREIDERGNRSGVRAFLPGPAQGLPYLPAMSGES